jgi:hypothetical protein
LSEQRISFIDGSAGKTSLASLFARKKALAGLIPTFLSASALLIADVSWPNPSSITNTITNTLPDSGAGRGT